MDTSTGETGEMTPELLQALKQRLGREPVPGDRVDADPTSPRVLVSPEVARRMAREANARHRRERDRERSRKARAAAKKLGKKGRARAKRAAARARARGT